MPSQVCLNPKSTRWGNIKIETISFMDFVLIFFKFVANEKKMFQGCFWITLSQVVARLCHLRSLFSDVNKRSCSAAERSPIDKLLPSIVISVLYCSLISSCSVSVHSGKSLSVHKFRPQELPPKIVLKLA